MLVSREYPDIILLELTTLVGMAESLDALSFLESSFDLASLRFFMTTGLGDRVLFLLLELFLAVEVLRGLSCTALSLSLLFSAGLELAPG